MNVDEAGTRLKGLRQARGRSLREVGRVAGVSASALSAIERGIVSPTLATLNRVLQALEADFASFLAVEPGRKIVFPPSSGQEIGDAHRIYRLLLPQRTGQLFQMVHERILAGDVRPEWETHTFDIGGVILSGGKALLQVREQGEWELEEGWSYYVEAGREHRLLNLSENPIEMITVACPARY